MQRWTVRGFAIRANYPRSFLARKHLFLTRNIKRSSQRICGRLQGPFTSPHSLSVNGSSGVAPGKTIHSQSIVLRHKVGNTLYITPMARTEYRYCTLFTVILGRTQNLHFAGDGWFMQRRAHTCIYIYTYIYMYTLYIYTEFKINIGSCVAQWLTIVDFDWPFL